MLYDEQFELLNDILEYLSYLEGEKAKELHDRLYDEIIEELEDLLNDWFNFNRFYRYD